MLKANIKEAVRSLYSAKQRSALALLGIIIGIGSVIAMISIGAIVQEESLRQFKEMGTDILTIRLDSFNGEPVTLAEANSILENARGIAMIAPFASFNGSVSFNSRPIEIDSVLGVTDKFDELNKLSLSSGRFISALDSNTHFAVIGFNVAQTMLESGIADPIGKKIKVNSKIFTVVGVLKNVKSRGLREFEANTIVMIPAEGVKRLTGQVGISTILARVKKGTHNLDAKSQLLGFFEKLGKPEPEIVSPEEIIAQMEKQMKLFTLLLGAIGSISLVVGGVGVMNVMLASVAERRKEIGIRRAIGARRSDIKNQFLIESLILSLIGGVLGIMMGVGAAFAISYFAGWLFMVSILSICLGFGVSTVVGVFFGFYPARRASNMDPIEALRS